MTDQTSQTTPDGLDVAAVKRVERYLDGRSGDDLIDWNGGGAGPELLASDLTLLLAALDEARREHRDLVSRLGFGDNITEPMANNDTVVRWVEEQVSEASEWRESQRWRDECAAAGHPDDEDCPEHDPSLRLQNAEAEVARLRAENAAQAQVLADVAALVDKAREWVRYADASPDLEVFGTAWMHSTIIRDLAALAPLDAPAEEEVPEGFVLTHDGHAVHSDEVMPCGCSRLAEWDGHHCPGSRAAPADPPAPTGANDEEAGRVDVQREDRYTITVDGFRVTATAEQEARIRAMSAEEAARFVRVMGGHR